MSYASTIQKSNAYFDHLYHMTHIDNLSSILLYGLLPHGNVHQKTDISDRDVNKRRARNEPIYSKPIHSYVPFYFNPKNPMLYVRSNLSKHIVILQMNQELLYAKGSLFTDGNASCDSTSFYSNPSNLKELDWTCLRAKENYLGLYDGKRKRMAECLVPNKVSAVNIEKILVNSFETKQKVDTITRKMIPCCVDTNYFF